MISEIWKERILSFRLSCSWEFLHWLLLLYHLRKGSPVTLSSPVLWATACLEMTKHFWAIVNASRKVGFEKQRIWAGLTAEFCIKEGDGRFWKCLSFSCLFWSWFEFKLIFKWSELILKYHVLLLHNLRKTVHRKPGLGYRVGKCACKFLVLLLYFLLRHN